MMESTGGGPTAKATLQPNKDSGVKGTATFTQKGDKVQLVANVSGLKPGQEHGFHIHEKGDCSSGDGMSTGGHFNPLGKQHGLESATGPHAGDLPDLEADARGRAEYVAVTPRLTLGPGPTSIFDADGSAIVIHAAADDQRTDPSGNSGNRILCGVIVAGPVSGLLPRP